MQNDLIHIMTDFFEGHAQETENGMNTGWRVICSICWVPVVSGRLVKLKWL